MNKSARALPHSCPSARSYRLGRGALASPVEEVADDQEDDRPDHEGASRAVLSDHAGERWDADHDPARIAMI